MRYIKINYKSLDLPDGWKAKVKKLQESISKEKDVEKRNKLIDDHDTYWKEIKPILAKIFHYKCWYTESPQMGTDVDVDHFRPKKEVFECKESHQGYWWLAFDISNYRYSCIVANRRRKDVEKKSTGGKGSYFPLWNEKTRAFTPRCNCNLEEPLLLDPCNPSDTRLIIFKEDGEAMARYSIESHPKSCLRANKSIELYSLNHSDFVRQRVSLRDQIIELLDEARDAFEFLETGDATHKSRYESAISKLYQKVTLDSPFSSFCIDLIKNYIHEDFLDGFRFI